MMGPGGDIPNNNASVIRMLSRELGRCNKGRNRILAGAVCMCIVTLTMVFGISFGKVRAEYTRAVRSAGTAASACIERADREQYEKVRSLSYVKRAGRCVVIGEGSYRGKRLCRIRALDDTAWEEITKPAYTDISGHYPKEGQEIMLSVKALKALGIGVPETGMPISLTVEVGLFRTEQEEFSLCGWYTDHTDDLPGLTYGYISREKCREWGYDMDGETNILICQADSMDWREAQKRLYKDVPGEVRLSVENTAALDAVRRTAGGYDTAVLGAVLVLGGMFFLVYNVISISMAGDIRQMGLLHTLGTTKKQIRKIYLRQILRTVAFGAMAGTAASLWILRAVLPKILGRGYLEQPGGSGEVRFFYGEILGVAAVFAVLLAFGVSALVIRRTVRMSCVESMAYTGVTAGRKKKRRGKEPDSQRERTQKREPDSQRDRTRKKEGESEGLRIWAGRRAKVKRRSADAELFYMARQNVTRYRGRFALTVFSLYLGIAVFFGAVFIGRRSDYTRVIERHPDFLIAGEFSRFGKGEGYGKGYTFWDAGKDPLETAGESHELLGDNYYDGFSPISPEARERLLGLDGAERETSHVTEGAYLNTTISRKGVFPFSEESQGMESIDVVDGSPMVGGFGADVVQILSGEEIAALRRYAEENHLPVDMDSLENGTGVAVLYDQSLSPGQQKKAAESVGEPVYFTALGTREEMMSGSGDWEEWEERRSDVFSLCGYLDNRAEGFPRIRQTWHGAEMLYFLISREGFAKLPTEEKTLCMELNAKDGREPEMKKEILKICLEEKKRREEIPGTGGDGGGEAGIFAICRSELLAEAEGYIRGSRVILGSISAVLLTAGAANFLNVMAVGILSRRKEFAVMECVGMTKRQKRRLLLLEGAWYVLAVSALLAATACVGLLFTVCL